MRPALALLQIRSIDDDRLNPAAGPLAGETS